MEFTSTEFDIKIIIELSVSAEFASVILLVVSATDVITLSRVNPDVGTTSIVDNLEVILFRTDRDTSEILSILEVTKSDLMDRGGGNFGFLEEDLRALFSASESSVSVVELFDHAHFHFFTDSLSEKVKGIDFALTGLKLMLLVASNVGS